MIKSATRLIVVVALLLTAAVGKTVAQIDDRNGNQFDQFGQMSPDGTASQRSSHNMADSLGTDKEIPKGIKVWTVDQRFGDRRTLRWTQCRTCIQIQFSPQDYVANTIPQETSEHHESTVSS